MSREKIGQISSQPLQLRDHKRHLRPFTRVCYAGPFRKEVSNLKRLNVGCLPALRPLNHIELHSLTLLEALEAARGDCGVMCENVFAVLTADEAKPLGIV
ncbi:MAG: hypothetical protein QOJ42_7552, partial [Acidobacteriaceae bacterium]|nr:hypothetical protein [Acidobacteriaceae bacterium]